MAITFVLAICAALFELLMGWLGFKYAGVQMNRIKRRWIETAFVCCGLLGVTCVGMLAYRSGRTERAHFLVTIRNTYNSNLFTPFSFLLLDAPLRFNVALVNVGSGSAMNTLPFARSSIQLDASEASQDAAIAQFESYSRAHDGGTGSIATKGDRSFITASGPVLSSQDIDDIKHLRKYIFVTGAIQFRDDYGSHTQHLCVYLDPQPNEVWDRCKKWNDEN